MLNPILRHSLATIIYRFKTAIPNPDDKGYAELNIGNGVRTPIEIINHMYQVVHTTTHYISDATTNNKFTNFLPLKDEYERFIESIFRLDKVLKNEELNTAYTNRLIQGPISDLFTHIGQLAMLQRVNGTPIKGQNYAGAEITVSA